MSTEIERNSVSNTLKLYSNKATKNAIDRETSSKISSSTKGDIRALPQPTTDFNVMYNELHSKFPEIINIDKPVLLAVGIRKEMSKKTGVSSVILKRWIAWYCRKSNYYASHKQGATRFNLDGSEAGIVTEKHQEKMDRRLEQTKNRKTLLESKGKDSDNDLSYVIINDVK